MKCSLTLFSSFLQGEYEVMPDTGLRVREQPDPKSKQLAVLQQGDRVTVYELRGNFARHDKGWCVPVLERLDSAYCSAAESGGKVKPDVLLV
jgi:hypothetical protein